MNLKTVAIIISLLPFIAFSQESVNCYGNVNETSNIYRIQASDSGFMAFGTIDLLSVQRFSFKNGEEWTMSFKTQNGSISQNIYGKGGIMENDSTFLVLGRIGTSNVGIIKATTSGRIIWANWYNTGLDEHPDKIIKLNNGDYLVSVRTNVSYYEFGEWGSRSGVFRIAPNGNLKWFRLLDYRTTNTSSVISKMAETNGSNILLFQKYGSKLGLIKLKANGDSLTSIISSNDFNITDADYDRINQKLYVVGSDKRIGIYDTAFSPISTKTIVNSTLNSLSSIQIINDTMVLLGGKYNNDACVLYADYQFNIRSCHYKRFSPSTASTLLGLFRHQDYGFSMIFPSIAITKHADPSSNLCFNKINGSQFATNNGSNLSFVSHVRIKGTATWDVWENIVATKTKQISPSSNCMAQDLGVMPDRAVHNNACLDFNLKLYLTNYGVNPITRFKLKYFINEIERDTTIILSSSLGSKQSSFINVTNLYLKPEKQRIYGWIYLPNQTNDGFNANDSFSMEIVPRIVPKMNISGVDSICEGSNTTLSSSGKSGTYDWYRNGVFVKQGTAQTHTTNLAGKYHVRLTDSACFYYSDTLQLNTVAIPNKPSISESNGVLSTNASGFYVWYYNNKAVDTSKTTINSLGYGTYKVLAYNNFGCVNESDGLVLTELSISPLSSEKMWTVKNGNLLVWNGTENVKLKIYSIDGKLLLENKIGESELLFNLPYNIYILRIEGKSSNAFYKIALGQ